MGWASGSTLFSAVIESIQTHVDVPDIRIQIYIDLIEAFEEADWDTVDECMGEDPAFDVAVKQLHPDWFDEEDDGN